ncbi:methyltransferase domain-containing protein [Treponema primitia]|uniref:methyltransferase domain-containing protein n=1 Tax=Treponema primitia TaxID=88058 RepID=UPI00398035A6
MAIEKPKKRRFLLGDVSEVVMNNICHAILIWYRRIWYAFRAYILEKPRGLDFHQRNQKLKVKGKNHGYAITPESHLKQIFSVLNITEKNSFLDIGCGKGFVLTYAAKYPYQKIMGIEIDPKTAEIARKNILILNLDNRINISIADATNYAYDEYDHFFLYNPFPGSILKIVIERILESLNTKPREITIIYFHPSDHNVLMDTGRFKVVEKLHSLIKDYDTYIYKNI